MKDVKGAIEHLKELQEYPATKKELVAECHGLADFSDEDKEWFTKHLEDKKYESADDVIGALGLDEEE